MPGTRSKSRMRSRCTSGSARGAARKGGPYRDLPACSTNKPGPDEDSRIGGGPHVTDIAGDTGAAPESHTSRSCAPAAPKSVALWRSRRCLDNASEADSCNLTAASQTPLRSTPPRGAHPLKPICPCCTVTTPMRSRVASIRNLAELRVSEICVLLDSCSTAMFDMDDLLDTHVSQG